MTQPKSSLYEPLTEEEMREFASARFDAVKFVPLKHRREVWEGASAMITSPIHIRIVLYDKWPREAIYQHIYGTRYPDLE